MARHKHLAPDGTVLSQTLIRPVGRAAQYERRTPGPSWQEPPWRIVWMSPCWHRGGLETVTITHIRRLDRERFEPILLVGNMREMGDSVPDGVELIEDEKCFEFYRCQQFDGARERSAEVLRELAPDVVIGQLTHAGLYGANDARVPVILEYWHVGRGWDAMEHPSDLAISVSHATTVQCHRMGRKPQVPVEVVYNGIDETMFRRDEDGRRRIRDELGIADGEYVIGWSGRIAQEKQPERWIETLGQLGPPCKGLMVGARWDNDVWAAMRRRATEIGLRFGRDVHHRSVAYAEMPAHYSAMDLLLHTREDEPFGMIFPEALLCGVPVVAFAGGGVPEIRDRVPYREDMRLVPAGDWQAMLSAAQDALAGDRQVHSPRQTLEWMFGAQGMTDRLQEILLGRLPVIVSTEV